ncbi:hypothetical protein [Streptomyces sp. NPDC006552]|uniref:hypothetical protein n=1 Tax=Streptomyces sp. NPDC006552 TaxID=3157179 RepID=UPI0033A4EFFC
MQQIAQLPVRGRGRRPARRGEAPVAGGGRDEVRLPETPRPGRTVSGFIRTRACPISVAVFYAACSTGTSPLNAVGELARLRDEGGVARRRECRTRPRARPRTGQAERGRARDPEVPSPAAYGISALSLAAALRLVVPDASQ